MNKPFRTLCTQVLAAVAACIMLMDCNTASAQLVAFPGAEGYGRFATGGRGGRVIFVTNTNDTGTGSLRAAVTTSGTDPITIVFKVSGIITLESDLRSSRSNMTIAGQTAPGDGICLRKNMVKFSGSNVIIRYIRFRVGDLAQASITALDTENMRNFIIDHCSFSWSVEENHTCYDNKYSTVQWCILSEGLYDSYNTKGARSYGSQWGGQYATFHHNLIAHNNSRSPRVNGARAHDTVAVCDYRNNVIYNWGSSCAIYGGELSIAAANARCNINWINNYHKPGPATNASRRFACPSAGTNGYAKWYFAGNYMAGVSGGMNTNNWSGVDAASAGGEANIKSNTAFSVEPVTTQSAADAYTAVLAGAGATLPKRDAVDTRVVNETRNGTATYGGAFGAGKGIIDSQSTAGGWPTYASATAPADTDADGMPNAWETANGLNPNNAADRNTVGSDGYTMLEKYLNGGSVGGGGSGTINAFATIQAESYSAMSGVQTETCSEGGLDVSYIENNDWIRFDDVDFGSGATGFSARVASNTPGGTIKFRIDAAGGTQIGTAQVTNTGGWQTWSAITGSISGVSGVHDLYLTFAGGTGYLFNINHFVFTGAAGLTVESPEGIHISPNPSQHTLLVEVVQPLEKNASVALYDEAGVRVFSSEVRSNTVNVDVSGFPKGIYIVKVFNGDAILARRFVKE